MRAPAQRLAPLLDERLESWLRWLILLSVGLPLSEVWASRSEASGEPPCSD